MVPIIAVVIGGYIAGASWPKLLEEHPLVLIALSPINRFLLLTTNQLGALEYFGVGLGRHLFPDPFFYMLGFWYGDRALRWAAENYPMAHRLIGEDGKGLENPATRKVLYPLAFFIPNNYVSLLCGAGRIPARIFIALNVSGTLARLILCRWLGSVFRTQLKDIADFIADYQGAFTIGSVIIVVFGIAMQFRKGSGDLVGLTTLSEELEET